METNPSHITKKRTLVKDRVGCVRSSTYSLPPGDHAYGLKKKGDPEGAGEIISNWVTANPSEMKKTKNMTVYQNILSIKHGCVTAKAMRQFAIDHPNIRLKEQLHELSGREGDTSHEGPFGIKTKFLDESIKDMIQAQYTNYWNDDSDYPDVSTIEKDSVFPRPKPTLSSELMAATKKPDESSDKEHRFIMKKFQKVKGKLDTGNSPTKTKSQKSDNN